MPVRTAVGTKISMGAAVTEAQSDTLAEIKALVYTEVKGVTALPEYGDESASVTSTDLGTARVRKGKGPRDAGNTTITVNTDPLDAGQLMLTAAEGTNFTYPFRIEYPDKPNPSGTNTVEYFRAIVRSKRRGGGDVSAVLTRTYSVDIDSEIFEEPATAGA